MASRREQKEQARNRRLAEERALRDRALRRRRLRVLGGLGTIAVVLVAVAIAMSSGASGSSPTPDGAAATGARAKVDALLAGIPQSGSTLGSAKAKVTLTEFGDLKCPICREFALGAEQKLIARDVRAGRLRIDYRSLCTATCAGPQPGVFPTEQAAALAAGEQDRAWYYIELFSIHAICEWCVSSAAIMTLLLAAAAARYVSAPTVGGAVVTRSSRSAAS